VGRLGDVDIDDAGNVYIGTGVRVRMVDTSGTITTIAGTGERGFSGDGGPAIDATFRSAGSIAVDGVGNVFVNDGPNHRIRRIDTEGIVTTVAGNGTPYAPNHDGPANVPPKRGVPATEVRLGAIDHLWADSDGNLYIAEWLNRRILVLGTDGLIRTIAGTGIAGFSGDGGPATGAQLSDPEAVAVAPDGTMYIADSGNNRIRKVVFP